MAKQTEIIGKPIAKFSWFESVIKPIIFLLPLWIVYLLKVIVMVVRLPLDVMKFGYKQGFGPLPGFLLFVSYVMVLTFGGTEILGLVMGFLSGVVDGAIEIGLGILEAKTPIEILYVTSVIVFALILTWIAGKATLLLHGKVARKAP
jgi:hypothetical protein